MSLGRKASKPPGCRSRDAGQERSGRNFALVGALKERDADAVLALVHPPITFRGSFCQGQQLTRIGTPGNDEITGTPGRDVIRGRGGSDEISGLGGSDLICGGAGKDTLNASCGPGRSGRSGELIDAGGDLVPTREDGPGKGRGVALSRDTYGVDPLGREVIRIRFYSTEHEAFEAAGPSK